MLLKTKKEVKKRLDAGFLSGHLSWMGSERSASPKEKWQDADMCALPRCQQGYSQIGMAPEDEEKLAFTTVWGTFIIMWCLWPQECIENLSENYGNSFSWYDASICWSPRAKIWRSTWLVRRSCLKDCTSIGWDWTQPSVLSASLRGSYWVLLSVKGASR